MATKLGVASAAHYSALRFPYWIDNIQLAGAGAETWTVPADVDYVIIVPNGGGVWANAQGAAAVPAGDVTDGTASAFIPQNTGAELVVDRGDVISFIRDGAATTNVNIWCYSKRH